MGRFKHLVGSRGSPAASVGVLGYYAIGQSAVRASLAMGRCAGGGVGDRGMTHLGGVPKSRHGRG